MLEEEKEDPVEELFRQISRQEEEVILYEQAPEEYDPLQIHEHAQERPKQEIFDEHPKQEVLHIKTLSPHKSKSYQNHFPLKVNVHLDSYPDSTLDLDGTIRLKDLKQILLKTFNLTLPSDRLIIKT